ncbi:d7e3fbb6-4dbe-4fa6-9e1a-a7ddc5b345d3 [Thermothielavioides terrestris]|uniref:D7e3fbb6-4dbe-4fa6-9e1a-a7ddc5b345d3 n=1 Tax=Thermothielavioides terrestris TaxID=2587410 RepID=A0A3S5CXD5_9PEZI|nr:d7e3fbb6-4dbe-4fa6-9e1a-a7ddc5b345d3 [Thermothielavioides terrestris]
MSIGLLVIAGIPTTIGVCEALSAQKKADAAAKEKAKFHLTATVSLDGKGPVECWCILKDGKLWIDHPAFPMPGHKFTGYYFTYPSEAKHLGLVSTIADDPPMLNWIFVDKDSGLLRHGGRQDTLGGHTIGPWHWTDDEQWLTLEGDASRFVAAQLENKKWAIAWDRDGRFSRGGGRSGDGMETDVETESRGAPPGWPQKWVPVMLQRKMQLGMESRYVKGSNG